MDELIEHIASRVGQRWVPLYSRLGLGARERYRFECTHQGKPEEEKWRSCALDTLTQWRKTVADLDETAAMTRLLTALRKIVGFEGLADELAQTHGIMLETPSPLKEVGTETPPLSALPITIRRLPNTNEVADPRKVEGKETTLMENRQSSQHLAFKGGTSQDDSGGSFMSDSEPMNPSPSCADTAQKLLHCAVDLRNSTHKFAILDISQRLRADKWYAISRQLSLREEDIHLIRKTENCIEERYYKILKLWVKSDQDSATFAALQDVLTSYNQTAAVSIMIRRLQTQGPTL